MQQARIEDGGQAHAEAEKLYERSAYLGDQRPIAGAIFFNQLPKLRILLRIDLEAIGAAELYMSAVFAKLVDAH